MAEQKTNAMRILEKSGADYRCREYPHGKEAVDGMTVAALVGLPAERVFKTLVTRGKDDYFVFVIPVCRELDLKKAAKAVGEKRVEMIKVAQIRPVTGYVRGGCSPLGMKKSFTTVFDSAAARHKTILVSAGRIGAQIEVSCGVLLELTGGVVADVTG